ncbi:MAG: isochorismatase family protein [Planctomycetaceae bacterium]|nr:isochorismatase family protein [Planctomycetaceae bacterium]
MLSAVSKLPRSSELLDRDRSRVVLIDLQERLVAVIPQADRVVSAACFLAQAAALFGVPVDVSEQYPQGLGATVGALAELAPTRVSKVRFSATECLRFPAASDPGGERDQILIAGVEAHVCVLQTAFDLLSLGYRVHVLADAVASRNARDGEIALSRLRDSGATISTVEAAAFEWCAGADEPQFKALSALVKARVLPISA